jgi:uncharacterized 2Fe-2S/4Fe-4S cluster protein (DUF4445 family)
MYAIAIDLGTTTLAASLVHTISGKRLAMTGALNPQRSFGADVVTRLDAAVTSAGARREMAALIRTELLRLAKAVCKDAGVAWERVERVAIAGNPAMEHLLLGLEVKSLAFPPHRPLVTTGTRLPVGELGWEGSAQAYVFPMPGGYVGGDTVAFLFGDRWRENGERENGLPSLYLDLGTNGEMALVSGETVWATSAAAGPAFEGGNLSCGMAALAGAISSVSMEGDRVRSEVIGHVPPRGVCGSGVIEAITQLLHHGILEPGGRLRDSGEIPSNLAGRVIRHGGGNAFVIHRDAQGTLLLTQADIRQVQLAKGAVRAGLEVLYERSGISPAELSRVRLTGSFGAVLRPEWLKTVGILDASMLHTISFTPEGALAGAERSLCHPGGGDAVERLALRFRVVPLSGTPLFQRLFLQHLEFPRP